jgi:uncharacterized protein (TIGR03437 family)
MEKGSIGMGLKTIRSLGVLLLGLTFVATLAATPRLNLAQTAFGPISVAPGSNGPALNFNAQNAGDGTLNVSLTSSASWLAASVGSPHACGVIGGTTCYPITITLNTASLAKGMYTGTITLSDPQAVDSPQTVTVTVAVGGNVPDQVTLYVPANGAPVAQSFATSSVLAFSTTQPANGPTLTVASAGEGSFGSTLTYDVTAKSPSGVAEAAYSGSFTVTKSPIATENKTVPVTINVTSKPIAVATALPVFRVGQAPVTQYVVLSNAGLGSLTTSATPVSTSDGGGWLSAGFGGPYVAITVDPTKASLTAGQNYQGTVTITTNAANSTITVPVTVEILAPGPPLVYAGRVVNIVNYSPNPLALGDLPAAFGEQLVSSAPVTATLPLQATLGGVTVNINNHPVPIYYVSATQINFQVPYELAPGIAVLRVDNNGQQGNNVFVQLVAAASKLFKATSPDSTVIYADANGPITPIKRGTPMVIYSLGLGQTTPPATSGVAAPLNTLLKVVPTPIVVFGSGLSDTGGTTAIPDFVGITPTTVGLYQVNVTIPAKAPAGSRVAVKLSGGPGGDSTTMYFNIQ